LRTRIGTVRSYGKSFDSNLRVRVKVRVLRVRVRVRVRGTN
jgi:hypothetical protein